MTCTSFAPPSTASTYWLTATAAGELSDAIALVEPAYEAQADDPAIDTSGRRVDSGWANAKRRGRDRPHDEDGNSAVGSVLMGASQYAAETTSFGRNAAQGAGPHPDFPAWTIMGELC